MLVNPDKNIDIAKIKGIEKLLPNSKKIISFSKIKKSMKKIKLYKKLIKTKLPIVLNGDLFDFESFTLLTSPKLENKKLDP